MKKSREELIEDFLSDIEVFDFDKPKPVSVYQLDISSRDDLDQYSWLFSRASELLFLLEKVKNEKTH